MPADRLQATEANPGSSWRMLALIAGFVVFWTLYASLSRYNLDLHGDMAENFAWGIGWQFGYFKHPPLFAWISAGWLSVFPRTNFFYHMLSAANMGLAVWAMWRISTRFFTPPQQVLLIAVAFVLPPLTFLALNYNATSAMAPFWALTFLSYLRVIERRRPLDAFLLGVFAGLAMLAKYHSVVMILALVAHALYDRDMRPLVFSRLTVLAALGGLLVIAPHAWWMVQNDFITVQYAAEQGPGDWAETLTYALRFIPAIGLYALPAMLLLALHRRRGDGYPLFAWPQWRALASRAEGRALIFAAVLPTLLTMLLGLAVDAPVSSLWSLPFFVFVPFLMVAILPGALAGARPYLVPAVIAVYGVVMLASAPFVRERTLATARSHAAMPIEEIAEVAERLWHEATGKPLAIVSGEYAIFANGTALYASDRPHAIQANRLDLTPWVTPDDIARDGAAYICRLSSLASCQKRMASSLGAADLEIPFSVHAPAGAGGMQNWDLVLLVKRPAA